MKLEIPIIGSQESTIYSTIVIIPRSIIILWYPNGKSVLGYLFTAIGTPESYISLVFLARSSASRFD